MQYAACIYAPDANGWTELDGVKARCVMQGCSSNTPDDVIAKAADIASDERGYAHYPLVYVEVERYCDGCSGTGKTAKRRGKRIVPYAWLTCKACKGEGTWRVRIVSVVNAREGVES